jgi:lipid II:glycine glycyltransferase (peptidoglycan interpeptide bridge formation enzyme)
MSLRTISKLNPDYTAEIDTVDEQTWYQFLRQFDDANVYQTWAWGMVTGGRRHMSHLVLRKNGEVVAIAQARIAKAPLINVGIAYMRSGPLWRYRGTKEDVEIFRQALRALRNEYVCKRGLNLRVSPNLFEDDAPCFSEILAEEGFSMPGRGPQSLTILMDLRPDLKTLRKGLQSHWKRHLKTAERNGLEIIEGYGNDLFEEFLDLYKQLVARKGFLPGADIDRFRTMQALLPDDFKLKILLCRSVEGPCAGLICSAIGKTGIYLFGATGNAGKKSSASYLLHWKFIEELKRSGVSTYDLDGINREKNPGTYRFKRDLGGENGREVSFLGRFDSRAGSLNYSCVEFGERVRSTVRALRGAVRVSRSSASWSTTAVCLSGALSILLRSLRLGTYQ